MADTEVTVICGRFGSGKTETAINYALSLARDTSSAPRQTEADDRPGPGVVLIDLDIVTPYFRSRETADAMREQGVEVIAPSIIGQYLDTPAITPQILGAIQRPNRATVLDVGGDRQGARALGQYSAAIRQRGYSMLFVANPFRPFTDTVEGLAASIAEIERSARLSVGSLVSNPNLMHETSADLIAEGHALIEAFARQLGLPIAFVCVERRWVDRFGSNDSEPHAGEAGESDPISGQPRGQSSRAARQGETRWLASSSFDQPLLVLDRHFVMSWE